MSGLFWLRIGAAAALWAVLTVTTFGGWMIDRDDAARAISKPQQRLFIEDALTRAPSHDIAGSDPAELSAQPGPPHAPAYLNLRELLTTR